MSSTLDTTRGILAEILQLGRRADSLSEDTQLLGSIPELDSMAVVGVITAIEDRFDVMIDDEEISAETFMTVGTLVSFIEQKTGT